jgi:uncharacterized protein (DUF2147 family)
MKKLFAAVFIAACAGFPFAQEVSASLPDPVEGFWLGVNGRGVVESGWEVYQSGGFLCGRMLSALGVTASRIAARCRESYAGFPVQGKVNELPVLGTPWIFGLQREETGRWNNGFVIDPSSGKIYKCRMTYHSADGKRYKTETLEMRGEIGLGIGGSQNWRRATREEAGALR